MSNEINEINEMNFIDSKNFISGFIDDIEYIMRLKNIIYDDPHTDHTLRVIKNKLENKQENLRNNQDRLEQLSRRTDVTAGIVENLKRFYADQNIVLINKCISSFNEISGNIHFPEEFNKKEQLKTLYGGEGESEILSSVSERSVLNNINQNEGGESPTQNYDEINSFIDDYIELPEGDDVDMQNSSVSSLSNDDNDELSEDNDVDMQNSSVSSSTIDDYIELPEGNDVDMQNSSVSSSTIYDIFELYGGDETQSNHDRLTQNDNHSRNNDTISDFSEISSISNDNNEEHDIDDSSYSDVLPASINNSQDSNTSYVSDNSNVSDNSVVYDNSYQSNNRSTSREIFKFKNIKNAFKRCLCFKH